MSYLKRILVLIIVAFAILSFASCFEEGEEGEDVERYVIMYYDGFTSRKINVSVGDIYTIPTIPYKAGYDFVGYFDAEYGGTQFTTSNGMCISEFRDNRNLVLYPQFKERSYKVYLDYDEAVTLGNEMEYIEMLATPLTVFRRIYQSRMSLGNYFRDGIQKRIAEELA